MSFANVSKKEWIQDEFWCGRSRPLNNISLEEWLALEPCVIYPRPVVDKDDLSDWDLRLVYTSDFGARFRSKLVRSSKYNYFYI